MAVIARAHMPAARALPFCFYLDSEGRFVHGSAGALNAYSLREALERTLQGAAALQRR